MKAVKVPVAALPVPFRTTESEPTFFSLSDPNLPRYVHVANDRPFPVALDGLQCTRFEVSHFTAEAARLG